MLLDASRRAGAAEFPLRLTRQEIASRLGTVRSRLTQPGALPRARHH